MKKVIMSFAFIFFLSIGNLFPIDRPTIHTKNSSKEEILAKISKYYWAQKQYTELVNKLEYYVTRHKKNPEWIISRMPMYWQHGFHYTRHTASDDTNFDPKISTPFVSGKYGNASKPTVRVPHELRKVRDNTLTMYSECASIENTLPYSFDGRQYCLHPLTRNWELVQPGEFTALLMEQILQLAEDASFLYWLTGRESYAEFAADILTVFCDGAASMDTFIKANPTLEKERKVGFLAMETLRDMKFNLYIPVIYDYLYNYLNYINGKRELVINVPDGYNYKYYPGSKEAMRNVQISLRKFAYNAILNGWSFNNWNLFEMNSLIRLSYGMDDLSPPAPEFTKDGKDMGREYFLKYVYSIEGPENSGGYGSEPIWMLSYNFNEDGFWNEPFGYHQDPVKSLWEIVSIAMNNGENVAKKYPWIYASSYVLSSVVHPNNRTPCVGDSPHVVPSMPLLERAYAAASKNNDIDFKNTIGKYLLDAMAKGYNRTSATLVNGETVIKSDSEYDLNSRSTLVPHLSVILQRNGFDDINNDLSVSLYGSAQMNDNWYYHGHYNGLHMELYGKGYVLGGDPRTDYIYESDLNNDYYRNTAAHNTVVVGEKKMEQTRGLTINAIEPTLENYKGFNSSCSFIDVSYNTTTPMQRRQLGTIRTSPKTGYYIDIFRSKNGSEVNDYLYHNLGLNMNLFDASMQNLSLTSTTELYVNPGVSSHPGYSSFANKKKTVETKKDVVALWEIVRSGLNSVYMKATVLQNSNRSYYTVDAPQNRSSPGEETSPLNWGLETIPHKTLVVRSWGEAWMRPFIVVYEPFEREENNSIQKVRYMSNVSISNENQGIVVHTKSGVVDYIFSGVGGSSTLYSEGLTFKGMYATIRSIDNATSYIYLGRGTHLSDGKITLESASISPLSANIIIGGDGNKPTYQYNADGDCVITIPYSNSNPFIYYTNLDIYCKIGASVVRGKNTILTPGPSVISNGIGTIKSTLPKKIETCDLIITGASKTGKITPSEISIYQDEVITLTDTLYYTEDSQITIVFSDKEFIFPKNISFQSLSGVNEKENYKISQRTYNTITIDIDRGYLKNGNYVAVITNQWNFVTEKKFVLKKINEAAIESYPNPFSPSYGEECNISLLGFNSNKEINVNVYDMNSLLVWTSELPPNRTTGVWDGKNSKGEIVPKGLYFIVVEHQIEKSFVKITHKIIID